MAVNLEQKKGATEAPTLSNEQLKDIFLKKISEFAQRQQTLDEEIATLTMPERMECSDDLQALTEMRLRMQAIKEWQEQNSLSS